MFIQETRRQMIHKTSFQLDKRWFLNTKGVNLFPCLCWTGQDVMHLKLQKAVNLECLHKIIGTSCKVSDILGLPEEEMYLCHWKFLGASEKQLSGRLLILLSSWAEEPTRLDGFLSDCKGAQKYPMLFWKGKKKHPHTAPRYCGSNASLWICNSTRLADDILIWKLTD